MQHTLSLGSVFRIPVRLHYSWFVASGLMPIGLIFYFHGAYTWWQGAVFGLIAVLLFFVCVCLREMARTAVTLAWHVPVRSVTLAVFGGVPRITEADTRIGSELLMATVGTLASLVLAAIFYLGYSIMSITADTSAIAEILRWQYFFNLMITVFNLIPGYPLDGGRFLRAIAWAANRNLNRSTRITSLMGFSIGILLILIGLVLLIRANQWFTGITVAFAGWLLQDAAWAMRRQARIRNALRGLDARYLLTDDYTPIKEQLTFAVVRDYIINSGQRCFIVLEEGELLGILTLKDIQIPEKRWGSTTVGQMMTPASKLHTAKPDEPVASLLEAMEEFDIDQIPVLDDGKLIGIVMRDRVLRFLKARAVLRA
ncbi:MAG: CBS domain-containing protein [Chloroflexi bacterium]|nr:CBS domain-containing protein [Chloroflexota bacterium]